MRNVKIKLAILIISVVIFAACKKEHPVDPTILRADTLQMGPTDTIGTINFLKNDTYSGLTYLNVESTCEECATYSNVDSSVTVKPSALYYGTFNLIYTIIYYNSAFSNSQKGTIVVKRGTESQIKTAALLHSMNNKSYRLFAVDNDTSGYYLRKDFDVRGYTGLYVESTLFDVAGVYSIVPDGNIYGYDSEKKPVIFSVTGGFSALEKIGNVTKNVTGITVSYGGHTFDYVFNYSY
jgi:hypothetical protein